MSESDGPGSDWAPFGSSDRTFGEQFVLLVALYFEYSGGLIEEIGWQGFAKVSRIWSRPIVAAIRVPSPFFCRWA